MRQSHLSSSDLMKELASQGFQLEQRGGTEWMAKGPKGDPVSFHTSTIDKGTRRDFLNVLTNLKAAGFVPQATPEIEREPRGEHPCEDCDYVGPYPRNLGRHQRAAQHGKYRRTPETSPIIIPPATRDIKPKHDKAELRAKALVRSIRALVAKLDEQCLELVQLVEPMEEENAEMRRKLKRVEELLGRAVDQL